MSKKKTILLSFVIILYVIVICIKLLLLGFRILKIDSSYMTINPSILGNYQEEIKNEFRKADINIPEQAKIKNITMYIVWLDEKYSIQYEEKGINHTLIVSKSPSKMPELVTNNLIIQDKQIRINAVKRTIVEFLIILIFPIVLYIIYYIYKKRKHRLQPSYDNN